MGISKDRYARLRHTRYQPLVDHLAASSEREIALDFAQIEAIMGVPLAPHAYVEAATWNGDRHSYVQAWRALGWSARLDRRNHCVIFTRGGLEQPPN